MEPYAIHHDLCHLDFQCKHFHFCSCATFELAVRSGVLSWPHNFFGLYFLLPPYLGLPCVLYLGRAVLTVFRETLVSFCCQARVTRLYLNVTLSINAMITSSYSSCKPKSDTGDENDEKANVCYITYQSCGEKHSWTRNSSRFAQINIRQLCVQCAIYVVQQPGNRNTAALGWEVVWWCL